ncbi:MAG: M48 family metallopeptidase [Maricaulaceae bacterium]
MGFNDDRYQLPGNTGQDIRKMYIFLAALFGSFALLGILIIIFAHSLVKYIPFSAEERFIKPYERLFLENLDDRSESETTIQSYLETLVQKLSTSEHLSGQVTFKIHYSDSHVQNAFATLGGHITVFRGLMNSVDSENGLAMIIAHEMAHIDNRDPATGMGRALIISMMLTSISGGHSENISDFLSNVGFSQFSQKQEQDADKLALHILYDYYGHVGGQDEFFRKMKDAETESTNIPVWLSSHPDMEKRITYLKEESADKGYPAGEIVALPDEIQEALSKNTLF